MLNKKMAMSNSRRVKPLFCPAGFFKPFQTPFYFSYVIEIDGILIGYIDIDPDPKQWLRSIF